MNGTRSDYRALIVDDNRDIRLLAKHALDQEGFECDMAPDGEKALNMAQASSYNLVLTDLRMPVMHGHALVTALSELPSPPTIVVITAVTELKLIRTLYESGVDEVFIKPVEFPLLALRLRCRMDQIHNKRGEVEQPAAVRTSKQITEVRKELQAQLKAIATDFQETIDDLQEQQHKLEENYLGSVRVLANLFEQPGKFEGSHAGRVEKTVLLLSDYLGMDSLGKRNLQLAALLHELGMFGMPDPIKNKPPWKLKQDEREAYESYPSIGAAILSQVPGSQEIVEIIANHAENHDGSGFPEGKRGATTPFAASILRLADGLDTFQMYLPHAANRDEESRRHLEKNAGRLYDPKIVKAAMEVMDFVGAPVEEDTVLLVDVFDLKPGMTLAQDVYGSTNKLLLRKGSRISEVMLPHLKNFVRDPKLKIFQD
jgi:response regulator RpfG family c-di-GMP phosphodiesterase